MTKQQKFKKEYAFELLKIAVGDMESTQILFRSQGGRRENVCFNAQQVVEKSVKAVLCFLEIPVPFTHNLDILLDRIPEECQLADLENANALTEYATIRRYEEGYIELDQSDLEASVEIAKNTLSWAQGIIK
ncbi:MAG: HEPN domain-containing protein [Bdellovibrionaceae bacterium]|jgi:HEPN domain-containing protein|nr:HEPN domain-containing protein [Pseudobdellovibrionaceae bacterium]